MRTLSNLKENLAPLTHALEFGHLVLELFLQMVYFMHKRTSSSLVAIGGLGCCVGAQAAEFQNFKKDGLKRRSRKENLGAGVRRGRNSPSLTHAHHDFC